MRISLTFIQILFTIVSIIFSVSFATNFFEGGLNLINLGVGFLGGCILSSILIGSTFILKKINLRSFNTAILGLFFGYLLAEAFLFTISGIFGLEVTTSAYLPLRFFTFLLCTYIGMIATFHAVDDMHLSIPFLEFKQTSPKKKDILVDLSILHDPRIIDLASTGLLDNQLIIPRFALKELYVQAESKDEMVHGKARRSLEIIKKLESLTHLELRYADTDFPEILDPMSKLVRLARFLDTNIITSDINRIQQALIEGVRIINIHMLSNALKPITQAGETISIKIQRYGKEARQGVGYLEDGTMVVVNGGAEFIGETIKANVLSVKHTSSGRMIFCNAAEEGSLLLSDQDKEFSLSSLDADNPKNFLTL